MNAVILILRLYAMFNGKKSILYTLLALLGGQIIAEIVAVRYTVVHEERKHTHPNVLSISR